mmetsp:Transcript_44435/g.52049  ORF Transcript_44435/g.52049 Transcript_44435/m.52049 type:complete len:104 (-) Transcript_44435:258-569(-)
MSDIPTEFGQLTELKELRMNANRIHGTIPTEIGKLTLMEKLILDYNRLSGTVPEELGLMKSLKEMTLYENDNLRGSVPNSICENAMEKIVTSCSLDCTCCTCV